MNTMEITKYVGAFCGSLLVFLLISSLAGSIYNTASDQVAYSIPVEEPAADEGAAEAAPAATDDVAALVAAADPAAGETIFKRCAACHKVDGTDGVGPHLNGVVNRDKGAVEGFKYSDAIAGMDGAWSEENLYAFLENPKGYAPGTAMAFAGLKKSEDRANVIAYLETLN